MRVSKSTLIRVGLPALVLAISGIGFASASTEGNHGDQGDNGDHGCHQIVYGNEDGRDWSKDKGDKDCHDAFTVSGSGACQKDGSLTITWVVMNSSKKALTITAADDSNSAVVTPAFVGSVINPGDSMSFSQTIDGTAASSTDLSLSGTFGKSHAVVTEKANTVTSDACPQPAPVTPPVTTTESTTSVPNVAATEATVPGFSGK
ncbi:MAG: hypothetical protein KGL39_27035 [Patescibacteria group bacterium]|nr:hypothetical protein [Patescibacteria group bacterium]